MGASGAAGGRADVAAALGRLGEPVGAYGPSPGQTFAGVLIGLVGGLTALGFAAGATGPNAFGRLFLAAAGAGGLGLAWWVWRLRKWRLAVFADGVVQVWAGRVEVVRWADVTELIDTRPEGRPDSTVRVDLVGPAGRVKVAPWNCRSWARLLAQLKDGAARHGVPARIEWRQSDN